VFSSRRRHTRSKRDWSSDVCSSDLVVVESGCFESACFGVEKGGGCRPVAGGAGCVPARKETEGGRRPENEAVAEAGPSAPRAPWWPSQQMVEDVSIGKAGQLHQSTPSVHPPDRGTSGPTSAGGSPL